MRLHRLEIEAFGPFAGREVLDFDQLSEAGLFLLNGETGAGKTSILDAVCYAFYAALPGARAGSGRLRSDHAADGTAPEVLCEFSTGGRRFEVLRSPAWDRPKSRGTGTTRQQAQSRLRELVDGEWVEKSTRNDEVAAEIRGVLGLDREQFTKVAMLPQGEFASFLRAKDTDREGLLRRLFDTKTYADVETLLNQRLAVARDAAEAAGRQRAEAVARLRSDAVATLNALPGQDPAVTSEPALEDVAEEELCPAIEDLLDQHQTLAAERVALAEGALATARGAAGTLRRSIEDRHRLAELEERSSRHAAGAEAARGAAERLEAHRRASGAEHARTAAATAVSEHAAAQAAWEAAARDVAAAPEAVRRMDTSGGAGGLGAALEAVRGEAAVLAAALPDEKELDQLRLRKARLGDESSKLLERLAQIERALGDAQTELPVLEEETRRQAALAAPVDETRQRLASAGEVLEAVRRRDRHAAGLPALEEAWVRAEKNRLDARDTQQALARLRLAHAAAVLAIDLEDGEPCAVCGALEHPSPAPSPEGRLVDDAAEEAAAAAVEQAESLEVAARKRRDDARNEAARLDGLAGGLDEAQAGARARDVEAELALALAAVERQRAASEREKACAGRIEGLAKDVAERRREQAALAASLEGLEERERRLEERLAGLRAESGSLAERLDTVQDAAARLSCLQEAERRREVAATSLAAAEASFVAALDEQGFPDPAAQQAALLGTTDAADARRLVEEHAAEAARLEALAAADEVARARADVAEGRPAPAAEDLAAADAAVEAAEGLRDTGVRRQAVLNDYRLRFDRDRARLEDVLRAQGPVLEEFDTVRSVAELVRGGGENQLRMTLSTYVLAARLEAVATAATERLEVMSSGRYALVHDDSRRGNNKSGLSLQVVDGWTGQRRDTATLSGGESFMASLALALGLADVVQQESGGIDMETLFVDEGFGSLDEGALELVMDALDGLRRGGRVVGLVSHVPEMKQRIPVQLHVHKGRRGSHAELVDAR